MAYILPRGDREWVDFINVWIELKKRDRTIDALYDYWILGKNAVPKQPHWSVIRNVTALGEVRGRCFTLQMPKGI